MINTKAPGARLTPHLPRWSPEQFAASPLKRRRHRGASSSLGWGGSESLRAICEDKKVPAARTVHRWLTKEENGDFRQQYARAREMQADTLFDQILAIADDGSNDTQKTDDGKVIVDHDHIQRSRLRVDARKWMVSKMAPKKYGEKVQMMGDGGGPIQHEEVIRPERDELIERYEGAVKGNGHAVH